MYKMCLKMYLVQICHELLYSSYVFHLKTTHCFTHKYLLSILIRLVTILVLK